jgi:fructoselysine-6-P-deglycase FrlB-like protein
MNENVLTLPPKEVPVTDTVVDPLPLKPIESDLADKVAATLATRDALAAEIQSVVDAGLRDVIFIGAGGSLIAANAAFYMLERETELSVFKMQSDEVNTARPRRIGPGTLVLLASHTGTTKETVAAAQFAKDRGASVLAVTKVDSPLAAASTAAFVGESDVFFVLAAYLLMKATGANLDWAEVEKLMDALPAALVSVSEEAEAPADRVAQAFKDFDITFVLASGPSSAWSYGLAMCYLQEMQWKHAFGYNSGEFFQGSFEVINDPRVAIINVLTDDPSRPMGERAQRFLETYASDRTQTLDVREFTMPGVPVSLRCDVSPLAVALLMGRVARHYEFHRNHNMDLRRYMFKVEY